MLNDDVRAFFEAPNFAALTTVMPNGAASTQIMWVDCDDDHVLINTEVHRQKFKNVTNDPRVTLAIWDLNRPYRYAEVRGRVIETITGPEARASIDRMAEKYIGRPYPEASIESERVILVIEPERQRVFDSQERPNAVRR